MTKMKISEEIKTFLQTFNIIQTKDNRYMNIPYWFKYINDDEVEILNWDYLPEDLIKNIKDIRENESQDNETESL